MTPLRDHRRRAGIALPIVLLTFGLLTFGLLAPRPADACSTCQVGQEAPAQANTPRTNASAAVRMELSGQRRTIGAADVDAATIDEQRAVVGARLVPRSWLAVGAQVPVARKRLLAVNGAVHQGIGLGDVAAAAEFRPLRRAPESLALVLGLQLPTATELRDGDGTPLLREAQLGSGAWTGLVGLSARTRLGRVTPGAALTLFAPGPSRFGWQPGVGAIGTLRVLVEAHERLRVGAALDWRGERPESDGPRLDPHSGGHIVFLSPTMRVSVARRATLLASVRLPFVNALRGMQREGWIGTVGVGIDVSRREREGGAQLAMR
jgi:hypothetical protein